MADTSTDVLTDLAGEVQALDELLRGLPAESWQVPTPAPGWNVADQVIHLGLFDRRAMWSMVAPERFIADRSAMATQGGVDAIHSTERNRDVSDLFEWWRTGAQELAAAAQECDLSARCAWYGPSMSGRSMLTARLMETWAHAHDIADAVGIAVQPTMRLKHIAHIGVRAMPFAFSAHKREVPPGDVYVALTAPDGSQWTWGDANASSSVRGPALGFCQVVTQRRHIDDCGLATLGEPATEWMSIAQAFAGPPGVGRTKGQFS